VIRVQNLCKSFGEIQAVRDVSFEVEKGEILGFLGPNGAGKTTTMRILACYIPSTSGTATVDGYDTFEHSLEVRRRIGYLPENPPLYREMTVISFLRFCGRLRGLKGPRCEERLDYVLERCGLGEVAGRMVGNLSKGYRQRVGLAQALIHDPPALILDEPTIGLDPSQIVEIRSLIRELGRDRTVILSTHILPEVQALCQRAIIIHRGRLAAIDTLEALGAGEEDAARVHLAVAAEGARAAGLLEKVPGVESVQREGNLLDVLVEAGGVDPRPALVRALVEGGLLLLEVTRPRRSLEEVFVRITAAEDATGEEEE